MPFSVLLLLFSMLQLWPVTSSRRTRHEDCKNVTHYNSTYNERITPEIKLLDATRAQKAFIDQYTTPITVRKLNCRLLYNF